MGFDLILGFREVPSGVHDLLAEQQMERVHILPASTDTPVSIHYYHRYIQGSSARGVWLYYHDGQYENDETFATWTDPRNIHAQATLTTPFGSNDHDRVAQHTLSRLLRDHYHALLLDPQVGRLVDN